MFQKRGVFAIQENFIANIGEQYCSVEQQLSEMKNGLWVASDDLSSYVPFTYTKQITIVFVRKMGKQGQGQ